MQISNIEKDGNDNGSFRIAISMLLVVLATMIFSYLMVPSHKRVCTEFLSVVEIKNVEYRKGIFLMNNGDIVYMSSGSVGDKVCSVRDEYVKNFWDSEYKQRKKGEYILQRVENKND